MKFQGSQTYVATQDLMLAVNAAITLQRPLLVKGEPGTGKTMLAEEVAQALDMPLLQWHIKSTTKAQQAVLARHAEHAAHRAAELGGHAQPLTRQQHALHGLAVGKLDQQARTLLARVLGAHAGKREQPRLEFGQRHLQGLGQAIGFGVRTAIQRATLQPGAQQPAFVAGTGAKRAQALANLFDVHGARC